MTHDEIREKLLAVATALIDGNDSLLLICSIFWNHKIKSKIIRDKSDDLLDIRGCLKQLIEELK